MKALEIKENVFWVGSVDWDLRDFHGYSTEKGSTYNAYLVKGDKNVLFDTVKSDHIETLLSNISQIMDPSKIDYIVSNHSEMDHSGCLPEVIKLVNPEKLYCTADGKKTLIAHFHDESWPFELVKDGDSLDLGSKTIEFIGTPMLHWPESMASFIRQDSLLISNDIFGQHWATSERFDDQVDSGELWWQSAKYFANIFLPTAGAARKFMSKLEKLEIAPDMIATDHGVIWRKDVKGIMDAYARWGNQETKPYAIVVYDTMWGSTAKMARAIARGIATDDVSVKLFDLRYNHRSDVATEMLEAKAIVLGSPVLNKGILPKIADMITYIKALKPTNRIGAAFGSYGWSDLSVKQLNQALEDLKVELVDPGMSVNYVPTDDNLAACEELGVRIREAILAR